MKTSAVSAHLPAASEPSGDPAPADLAPANPEPADPAVTRRAFLGLLAGAILIAFAPILVRWSELAPTATGFQRMLLALPWFALWFGVGPGRSESEALPEGADAKAVWGGLLLAGLCFSGDLAAWHRSIRYTSVANATLLANLAPLLVTLIAWFWLGERITRVFLVGLALALGGAFVLVQANLDLGPSRLRGDLLGLVTAGFYAGYILSVKQARRRLGAPRVMAAVTLVCTVVLGLLAWVQGESLFPVSTRGWLVCAGLGLLPQALGQGLIAHGLAHLPASFSSVTLLVQPATATLLAWGLLGEPLSSVQALGGAVLVVGIWLCRDVTATAPPRDPAPPPPELASLEADR